MLSVYPAIFTQSKKDGGYAVVFPDLNHLATCGDDMQEAMEMAVDCLAGYLFTEKLDGNEIPAPTPLEKVDPHCEDIEEYDDDVAALAVDARGGVNIVDAGGDEIEINSLDAVASGSWRGEHDVAEVSLAAWSAGKGKREHCAIVAGKRLAGT